MLKERIYPCAAGFLTVPFFICRRNLQPSLCLKVVFYLQTEALFDNMFMFMI